MKQLERLRLLYTFLKQQQADINGLLEYLQASQVEISRRQLERDLNDVALYFLQENEQFEVSKVKRNKQYQIVVQNHNKKFAPAQNARIVDSNFYEIQKSTQIDYLIHQIYEAIFNQNYIVIDELKYDVTVDNYSQSTQIVEFAPIRLIHHRGTVYIIGFNAIDLYELVIYEVAQLVHIVTRKKEFNFKLLSKRADLELDKRFGVTKNINHQVYDIQLEFTNVTGAFIKRFHWHATQKFHKKPENDNLIMSMRCGINRELLGWLCQWMYNAKIVSPPILQEYYDKTVKKMKTTQLKNQPFLYRNIFEPKE